MKGGLQRLILSLHFFLIAATISRLIIYASPLLPSLSFSALYIYFYSVCLSFSHHQTPFSSFLLMRFLHAIILNLLTCPPQVFRSASYGSDCQLWDSSLGPGEDRQWHSARHPPLRSHRLSCSYHTHTRTLMQTLALLHSSHYSVIIATVSHTLFTILES